MPLKSGFQITTLFDSGNLKVHNGRHSNLLVKLRQPLTKQKSLPFSKHQTPPPHHKATELETQADTPVNTPSPCLMTSRLREGAQWGKRKKKTP